MAYPSGFEFTLYSVAACRTTRMSGVIRSNGLTARFRFPSRLAQWILDRLAAPPRQLWVRFADGRGTDKTLPPGGPPRPDMSRTGPLPWRPHLVPAMDRRGRAGSTSGDEGARAHCHLS